MHTGFSEGIMVALLTPSFPVFQFSLWTNSPIVGKKILISEFSYEAQMNVQRCRKKEMTECSLQVVVSIIRQNQGYCLTGKRDPTFA